jgi:hypothetical protein
MTPETLREKVEMALNDRSGEPGYLPAVEDRMIALIHEESKRVAVEELEKLLYGGDSVYSEYPEEPRGISEDSFQEAITRLTSENIDTNP